ncbi:SAUR-like auxin-responsive protein family [Striga asiatica]|uniref:SAUR-like auxin-responsive protein family n=1 Tax=Striga asiatica TaxID=4170 RepID=A0A5A7P6G8_STRAF|nr:SAUR-like auxin-responsive protein family [Striga asiatica]
MKKKMMDSGRFVKKMVRKVSKTHDKQSKAMEKHFLLTDDQLISDNSRHKSKNGKISAHIPRGFVAVYVGPDSRRFLIPTKILSVPKFKELMDKSAEEYGYEQQGGLSIPCDEDEFRKLLAKKKCSHRKKQNDCRLSKIELVVRRLPKSDKKLQKKEHRENYQSKYKFFDRPFIWFESQLFGRFHHTT